MEMKRYRVSRKIEAPAYKERTPIRVSDTSNGNAARETSLAMYFILASY